MPLSNYSFGTFSHGGKGPLIEIIQHLSKPCVTPLETEIMLLQVSAVCLYDQRILLYIYFTYIKQSAMLHQKYQYHITSLIMLLTRPYN